MDTEILECPICNREMTEIWSNFYGKTTIEYRCDRGHENVLVKYDMAGTTFVYLGDGCYLLKSDNTSCEKAIARMRREYEEGMVSGRDYENGRDYEYGRT